MAAKDIDSRPRSSSSSRPNLSGGPPKPRILIVDDNTDAGYSLGRLLALLDYETLVVQDGLAALLQIESFSPDAVLLDLGMPGMDGLQTAEQIRKLPAGQDIALIAVTGWGQERDRQRTQAAGFAAHLTKPVNTDQLESLLKQLLRKPKPS